MHQDLHDTLGQYFEQLFKKMEMTIQTVKYTCTEESCFNKFMA